MCVSTLREHSILSFKKNRSIPKNLGFSGHFLHELNKMDVEIDMAMPLSTNKKN